MFVACVINQNKDYAKGFLKRVKFVYQRIPKWLQIPVCRDTTYNFDLNHGSGEESELLVVAGGDAAGRSITGDLIIFDEHAFIDHAQETREACEPTLEVSGGQALIISTSSGPYGDFYETWITADDTKYVPVFLHWSDRPGRDAAWYESVDKPGNPLFRKREYPDTPSDAFEYAEGRCFPAFRPETHVRIWEDLPYRKNEAELYRCVDFGHSAPFACCWLAHWPAAKPGFTVEPDCPNTIKEFLAYHYDSGKSARRDRPAMNQADHTCDALRYLIVSYGLEGHVHIYRELYVPNSAASGRTDLDDIRDIHTMSGWIEAAPHEVVRFKPGDHAERFIATVTDPSLGKTIILYNDNDIDCHGYVRPIDMTVSSQIVDGIRTVNLLIDGTHAIRKTQVRTDDQLRERDIELGTTRNMKRLFGAGDCNLQEAAYREAARLGLKERGQQSRRRVTSYMDMYRRRRHA